MTRAPREPRCESRRAPRDRLEARPRLPNVRGSPELSTIGRSGPPVRVRPRSPHGRSRLRRRVRSRPAEEDPRTTPSEQPSTGARPRSRCGRAPLAASEHEDGLAAPRPRPGPSPPRRHPQGREASMRSPWPLGLPWTAREGVEARAGRRPRSSPARGSCRVLSADPRATRRADRGHEPRRGPRAPFAPPEPARAPGTRTRAEAPRHAERPPSEATPLPRGSESSRQLGPAPPWEKQERSWRLRSTKELEVELSTY